MHLLFFVEFNSIQCCIRSGIRAAGHPDWFQLVGLIHDMGKIMFMWGNSADGQMGKQS